jgi:3-phenylpropionate/trans-cinnamate dioxygenase ferredoxin reductase subunit
MEWYADQGIDYLAGKAVVGLDGDGHKVSLDDGTELGYEKCLVATGMPVRRIPVPGLDKKGVNYVKTVDDAEEIIANVKKAKRAIVIGSGFISFEMLDMLHLAGLEVESVIREKYFWEPILDETAGRMIERKLADEGVKVRLESEMSEVQGDGSVEKVVLKDGTEIDCQMIILGIGVSLREEWLEQSGLRVDRGIVCDAKLRTNLPDVFTAGDVAEYEDLVFGDHNMCGLWIHAQMQGKTAALNMAGRDELYRYLPSYTAHGFGMQIGFVGQVWRDENRELIARGNPDSGKYTGIVVRDGKQVVGAFTVNVTKDMAPITRLVESGADISELKGKLADESVDLSTLLSPQ